ncbi:hypothetical protein D3C76_499410 [compost metagenome]
MQRQWHVPDFIKEQRTAICLHEAALTAFLVSPREGTLAVAEQFAVDQRLGYRRAVERHERRWAAITFLVDGLGQGILAGTRFTQQQQRQILVHDLADQPYVVKHARILPGAARQRAGHFPRHPGARLGPFHLDTAALLHRVGDQQEIQMLCRVQKLSAGRGTEYLQ